MGADEEEPIYDGINRSMEPSLDDLRRRLIQKIELEVKETFDSFSAGDDFLLAAGNLCRARSSYGSREQGVGTSEQHHNDDDKYREKTRKPCRKIFRERESVMTVLLRQSKNIRTIYNIFAAILIHIFLNTWATDWIHNRSVFENMEIIWWNFGNLPIVITIWLSMNMCTLLVVYPLYNFWASSRTLPMTDVRVFDSAFLVLYVAYQTGFFIIPAYLCRVVYNLPPASSLIVILEQIRLLMKAHSFVRENAGRSMRCTNKSTPSSPSEKSDSGEELVLCPDFSCYLYFLFAPTLIYRDHYPMTESIDWTFVRSNLVQAVTCIFYAAFIFSRFIFPGFSEFGTQAFDLDLEHFVQSVFSMVLPGTLLLMLFHFMFLHSWLNAWAEMLRFADRVFYRDWWTSTSYGQFYRTWNVVVHDFLKAYIMYDSEAVLVWLFGKTSKNIHFFSILITFLVSALVHEYVIIMAAGFFYPILFLLFSGCGFWFMIIVQNNRFDRFQNTIFWFLMSIGMGVLICWYSQEWYAQMNCPHKGESVWDYLIPRTVACYWNS